MSYAQDHSAWQQRISKEVGRKQWFINKLGLEASQFDNVTSKELRAQVHGQNRVRSMAPYIRCNREAYDMKKMGGYINDSSYSNACDPNSMRDQGGTRNAIYHIKFTEDQPQQSFSNSNNMQYNEFIIPRKGDHNNTFYSFGGKRPLSAALNEETVNKTVVNPIFSDYQMRSTMGTTQRLNATPILYKKDPKVNIVDYTKNISQSIFSPGLTKSMCKTYQINNTASKLLDRKTNSVRKQTNDQQDSFRRQQMKQARSIEKALAYERQQKQKMQKDIDEIRSQFSQISKKLQQ